IIVNTSIDNNECVEVVQMQKFVKKKGPKAVMKHQDQSSVKARSIGVGDSDEDNEDDYEDDDDDEEEEEEDTEFLDETRCLFCSQRDFPTFTQNFEHMQKAHGFFIPLEKRLVSLEGLFEDVYEVVGEESQCTWCWHKFRSLRAVQAHMRHSGHCKLNLDRGPSVYSIKVTDDADEKEKMDMIEQGDSIFVRHYKWGKYNENADMKTIDEDKDYQIIPFDESKDNSVVDINHMNELVRKDGTVIGHRDFAISYKQKTRESFFYKSNEQIIAEINNPNKRFHLEEMIASEKRLKQKRVESIKQMKEFKKHKEDALIRLNMRSHKFHIDHFAFSFIYKVCFYHIKNSHLEFLQFSFYYHIEKKKIAFAFVICYVLHFSFLQQFFPVFKFFLRERATSKKLKIIEFSFVLTLPTSRKRNKIWKYC
ncbi:zinc finger protein, partial [Reticulomyxa filosa]